MFILHFDGNSYSSCSDTELIKQSQNWFPLLKDYVLRHGVRFTNKQILGSIPLGVAAISVVLKSDWTASAIVLNADWSACL